MTEEEVHAPQATPFPPGPSPATRGPFLASGGMGSFRSLNNQGWAVFQQRPRPREQPAGLERVKSIGWAWGPSCSHAWVAWAVAWGGGVYSPYPTPTLAVGPPALGGVLFSEKERKSPTLVARCSVTQPWPPTPAPGEVGGARRQTPGWAKAELALSVLELPWGGDCPAWSREVSLGVQTRMCVPQSLPLGSCPAGGPKDHPPEPQKVHALPLQLVNVISHGKDGK